MTPTTFYADAVTVEGYETVFETDAATKAEAWSYFEDAYPDCRIKDVMSAQEYEDRDNARYVRIAAQMDRDYY